MSRRPVVPYTIESWFAKFLELRTDISADTKRLYGHTYSRLATYFGADRRIASIRRLEAAEFVAWLSGQNSLRGRGDKPLSPTTIARFVRDCKVIFGKAVKYEAIEINPFAMERSNMPRLDADWHHVTLEELDRLIAAAPTPGWRALWALTRLAGLRAGEARRLLWADVDFDKATVTVRAKPRANGLRLWTTKQKRREVPMQPRLVEVLRRVRQEVGNDEPRVCPVYSRNSHRDARAQMRRAGVPEYAKPFHTPRKCLESEWLNELPVMDVCRWLGHHPNVAAEFYHRPTPESLARVTGRAAPVGEDQTDLLELVTKAWPTLPERLRMAIAVIAIGSERWNSK